MLLSIILAALTAATPTSATEQNLLAIAKTLLPEAGGAPIQVRPSALNDIYEVSQGTRVFYLSADGRHLLNGPLFDVNAREDLTAQRQAVARQELLKAADLATKIVFPAATSKSQRVTVVTNIDCTFCRRLHTQLEAYAASGIELSYVVLPSGGPAGFERTAALMCEPNPAHAVSEALLGNPPAGAKADCEHNLNQHIALATQLGAGSTPNLILPSGELIQGYQTPEQLADRLR